MKSLKDKEKLFLEWFHTHREDMQINLSTVGGLRAAYFGGLEIAEQSAEKLNIFSACASCEYNPCDVENNLDYCPAQERRIKFNPAIISG